MRILAVDPGEKRLGISISDPGGVIAYPFTVVMHIARSLDAAVIAGLASQNEVGLIIVGQALDEEGEVSHEGRKAERLAEAIRLQTSLPVILWDESGSTQAAIQTRITMRTGRKKRAGHLDDLAATFILQSYLDAHPPNQSAPR
jgi:putative Holliday junction resolvase